MSRLPSFSDVCQIDATLDGVVPAEFIDENGHMNVGRYFEVAGHGMWQRTIELGMGKSYLAERRLTTFTAENHIVYRAEMVQDDRYSVHPRLLARSDKVLHAMSFVVDRSHERVAAWFESTVVHVSLDTRRPVPFPDDIAAALDDDIARSEALGWPAPVCGAMGIRT